MEDSGDETASFNVADYVRLESEGNIRKIYVVHDIVGGGEVLVGLVVSREPATKPAPPEPSGASGSCGAAAAPLEAPRPRPRLRTVQLRCLAAPPHTPPPRALPRHTSTATTETTQPHLETTSNSHPPFTLRRADREGGEEIAILREAGDDERSEETTNEVHIGEDRRHGTY